LETGRIDASPRSTAEVVGIGDCDGVMVVVVAVVGMMMVMAMMMVLTIEE
jgi:hypothetical protein